MTWIIEGYTSKGELKRHIAQGANPIVFNPSVFNEQNGPLASLVKPGDSVVVTNHPKRSWFAKITRKQDGSFKVE